METHERKMLEHRIGKVRNYRVRKEEGLIKHKTRGHIEHEAREARGTLNIEDSRT